MRGTSGARRHVFLLGHGISYSASPAMHNAAFGALGLDWTYELLDVPPAELTDAISRLRSPDTGGANVTIPYKRTVMDHLDTIDPEAVRAGAVNTIGREGARLTGSNTDVAGIRSAIADIGLEARGADVLILGAGGSARAAAIALDGAHLTFVARRPHEVDLPGRVVAWTDPSWPRSARSADLLLNATPLGRREEMPLRPNALPRDGAVIDLVYVPGGTPLVRKARSLGLRVADGWGILLAQGARSFEIWTGKPAPLEAMRETLGPRVAPPALAGLGACDCVGGGLGRLRLRARRDVVAAAAQRLRPGPRAGYLLRPRAPPHPRPGDLSGDGARPRREHLQPPVVGRPGDRHRRRPPIRAHRPDRRADLQGRGDGVRGRQARGVHRPAGGVAVHGDSPFLRRAPGRRGLDRIRDLEAIVEGDDRLWSIPGRWRADPPLPNAIG